MTSSACEGKVDTEVTAFIAVVVPPVCELTVIYALFLLIDGVLVITGELIPTATGVLRLVVINL